MDVVLRLTGTVVRELADNGHLPGWPGNVDPTRADPASPDYRLDVATARWYAASHHRRVGSGHIQVGRVDHRDAQDILNYLESVVDARLTSSNGGVRAEGRAIRRAIETAVQHLRQSGVPVKTSRDAAGIHYRIIDTQE